jgi:hypothetical protein
MYHKGVGASMTASNPSNTAKCMGKAQTETDTIEIRVKVSRAGHPFLFEELSRLPVRSRAEWLRSQSQNAVRQGSAEVIERIFARMARSDITPSDLSAGTAQVKKVVEPIPPLSESLVQPRVDAHSAALSGGMDDVEL